MFDCSSAKILVVGDIMLDRYWAGIIHRLSPEAPAPILSVDKTTDQLGGAGNVALNLKTLNAQVGILSLIGDDQAGRVIQQQLQSYEIKDHLIVDSQFQTIIKLRAVDQLERQLLRLDFEKIIEGHTEIEALFVSILPDYDYVIFSDYQKGALYHIQRFIQIARKMNKKIAIDPKSSDIKHYQNAFILTPNLAEFKKLVGEYNNEQELQQKAFDLLQNNNIDYLLITRSENGVSLHSRDPAQAPTYFHAQAHSVSDVSGAGDTLIATLVATLAANLSIEQAVQIANYAASIVVTKRGTVPILLIELLEALKNTSVSSELTMPYELTIDVKMLQKLGKKIVFTNGCFDILHAGHVQYLKEAKALGDYLIVAINSDESIKRLKGNMRPFMSLKERSMLLGSLACVDRVTVFEDDTPLSLIEKLKPNILAKGGDYTAESVVGYDSVLQNKGEVKILPHYDNLSTSSLVKRIVKQYNMDS